jgi:hypothetical protein
MKVLADSESEPDQIKTYLIYIYLEQYSNLWKDIKLESCILQHSGSISILKRKKMQDH